MQILIINGPNLNMLGKREPEIYGTMSFEEYLLELKKKFPDHHIEYFQSNHEGAIIDKIQQAADSADGIIINAAGYSHTSIALADSIKAIQIPSVEVHISNIYAREEFRHHSYLTSVCTENIIGKGLDGYAEAIDFLVANYTDQQEN